MRKSLLLLSILAISIMMIASFSLSGCKTTVAGETTAAETTVAGETTQTQEKITLEVFHPWGAADSHYPYLAEIGKAYTAEHPNIEVKVSGEANIWEIIRPRFVAGNPPDLVFAEGPYQLLNYIEEGLIFPLDEALQSPPYGETTGKWLETFLGNGAAAEKGGLNFYGHIYAVPFELYTVLGLYNVGMWKENGWNEPTTWSELLNIFADAKSKGIAPITLAGSDPGYCSFTYVLMVQRLGDAAAIDKVIENKTGFLTDPSWLEAAKLVRELLDKDYYLKGFEGLTSPTQQMSFVQSQAAFYVGGSWAWGTQAAAKVAPEGFEYGCFRFPAIEGGKGDPKALPVTNAGLAITSGCKNKEAAVDFIKFLTSKPSQEKWVAESEALATITGVITEENSTKLMVKVNTMLGEAKEQFDLEPHWGSAFNDEYNAALLKLFHKEVTPEQFVQLLEDAAKDITKM